MSLHILLNKINSIYLKKSMINNINILAGNYKLQPGIINCGFTCYHNVAIQIFFRIEELVTYLIKKFHKKIYENFSCLITLLELMKKNSSNDKNYIIKECGLIKAICSLSKDYKEQSEGDPVALLNSIFDNIFINDQKTFLHFKKDYYIKKLKEYPSNEIYDEKNDTELNKILVKYETKIEKNFIDLFIDLFKDIIKDLDNNVELIDISIKIARDAKYDNKKKECNDIVELAREYNKEIKNHKNKIKTENIIQKIINEPKNSNLSIENINKFDYDKTEDGYICYQTILDKTKNEKISNLLSYENMDENILNNNSDISDEEKINVFISTQNFEYIENNGRTCVILSKINIIPNKYLFVELTADKNLDYRLKLVDKNNKITINFIENNKLTYKNYELIGIIIYKMEEPKHYYSYIYNQKNWYMYNDDEREKIYLGDNEEIHDHINGYNDTPKLLLYREDNLYLFDTINPNY